MKLRDAETQREESEMTAVAAQNPPGDSAPVIEAELVDEAGEAETQIRVSPKADPPKTGSREIRTELAKDEGRRAKDEPRHGQSAAVRNYLLLPLIFLTVTLLGGLRLSEPANAFVFLKPALVCLVFAAVLLVLFFRAGLVRPGGWFSESFPALKNFANAVVLFTLFTASAQIFNSLLPEQGLPFWVVGLLFFWTLWNNLFSVFTARRLVHSLGSLFGLAFVLKYLVLANLTAPASESWLRALVENPGREIFTYLLDLPRYAAGTGYVQFFAVIFYLVGLFLLAPDLTQGDGSRRGNSN